MVDRFFCGPPGRFAKTEVGTAGLDVEELVAVEWAGGKLFCPDCVDEPATVSS